MVRIHRLPSRRSAVQLNRRSGLGAEAYTNPTRIKHGRELPNISIARAYRVRRRCSQGTSVRSSQSVVVNLGVSRELCSVRTSKHLAIPTIFYQANRMWISRPSCVDNDIRTWKKLHNSQSITYLTLRHSHCTALCTRSENEPSG